MTENSIKNLGPYVFDDIVDGVLLLTSDGTIAYMNQSAQAILNITADQMGLSLPGTWLQQMDPRNDDICQSILDALHHKWQKLQKTVTFYTPDNEKRILHIKSSYWKSPDLAPRTGVLLIIQDITAEELLKKEKEDVVLAFSFLLTVIGIWALFDSLLTYLKVDISPSCMTYILLGFGIVFTLFVSWKTDLVITDFGLSFRNIRKPILTNVVISLSACLFMIVVKAICVREGFDYFPEGQPFFDLDFTLGMKLYPLSVLLQEFLSQSIIHECLIRILKGKPSHFHAVLLSSVLFTVLHIHRGFGFMICSLILGCIIGMIYRRQRTIWGLCITHYSVSMMAFILNWV